VKEEVFYSDENGVKVTNARFVVGSTIYPISGITSVRVHKIPSEEREEAKAVGVLLLVGIVLIIIGFYNSINFGLILAGLGIAGFGLLLISRIKDIYILKITTAGGEVEALKKEGDLDYINNIVESINKAIIQSSNHSFKWPRLGKDGDK
jgi:hypothetical protein